MRILYNSLDPAYKTPFGTLTPGEPCRLRLDIPLHCRTTAVRVVFEHEDASAAFDVPMARADGAAEGYERFAAQFAIDERGLYFYYFRIETENGPFSLFRQGEDTNMEAGDKWQLSCVSQEFAVPEYAKGAVMYQIFPDRFCRVGTCDLTGKLEPYRVHDRPDELPDYLPDAAGRILNCDFFGGNFAGITSKLDYLRELGVTLVYLNPVFMAYSNHRYDTFDYKRPDPMLGTERDFTALCDAAHARGMRVILDGVFSHTGSDSIYFDRRNRFGNGACSGPSSPYYRWYQFDHFPDRYNCWWGIDTLPCVNKLEQSYVNYIIDDEDSVVAHWLRLGADGYRLDVVDELPDEFVLKLKRRIRQVKPDALLIGEVWEDASNKIAYSARRRYFVDAELDSVMNYPWRTAILNYCGGSDDGSALRRALLTITENYPKDVLDCTMNLLGTHDTPRILSVFAGNLGANRVEQAKRVLTDDERREATKKLKMAAFLQFMLPGVPCIYYADETGMEGAADPFNRKCFPWGQENGELGQFYRALARLKNCQPALKTGALANVCADGGQVRFDRVCSGQTLTAACNRGDVRMVCSGRLLLGCGLGDTFDGKITIEPGGFALFAHAE